jgi:hypothetical protein
MHLLREPRGATAQMGGLSTGDNTLADLIYATQEVVNTREGAKALLSWIVAQGIGTALVDRARQALAEWRHGSFNGKFRDECIPVADICRKAGISQATYSNWKKSTMGCCRRFLFRIKAVVQMVDSSPPDIVDGVDSPTVLATGIGRRECSFQFNQWNEPLHERVSRLVPWSLRTRTRKLTIGIVRVARWSQSRRCGTALHRAFRSRVPTPESTRNYRS